MSFNDSSEVFRIKQDDEHECVEKPLENAWGSHGVFQVVGNGKQTNDNCGKTVTIKGCMRVNLHRKTNLEGVNYAGKVFTRRVTFSCGKPSCPICYMRWAVREAGRIKARLDEASKRSGQVEHIISSVPSKDYGMFHNALRRKNIKILKSRGVVGACLIFHGFRYNVVKQWYFSPHFHALGFVLGGYSKCRNCYRKCNCDSACDGFDSRAWKLFNEDGYYVKVMGKRKTIFGTAWYQLSHSSYKIGVKRFHIATWFGNVSYRKLKVTVEIRRAVCPICQHDLVKLHYSGNRRLHLSEKLDSFEDYKEDGIVVWVEVESSSQAVARNFGGI